MDMVLLAVAITLCLPLFYHYALLLAGALAQRGARAEAAPRFVFIPQQRFMIAIAAHDEEAVIASSVARLQELAYPRELYTICVVADHCHDKTAEEARGAGAVVYERSTGPRGSKGAALSWLFGAAGLENYDAVVIFDADTLVDTHFLRWMNDRLLLGENVIQGQHIISNPEAGWFAALTEAVFLVDNLTQNAGRVALGAAAKLMGDSLCFGRAVFPYLDWAPSLTEDYHMRQKLLLAGEAISYEPRARAWGEAPPTWELAKRQRTRWMQGTLEVQAHYRLSILRAAWQRGGRPLWEASLEELLPCFSSYAVGLGVALPLALGLAMLGGPIFVLAIIGSAFTLLLAFPFLGLWAAGAPPRSYRALLRGPQFIAWRSLMAIKVALGFSRTQWIRTPHGVKQS